MTYTESGLYALLWLSFGVAHSLLASHPAKRYLEPLLGHRYRFSYNLISTLHIGVVFILGRLLLADNSGAYDLTGWVEMLILVSRLLGIGIMLVALSQYDLGLFSGLKQLRQHSDSSSDEPLHLTGMHRYIRHPIYLGAYLFLWGGVVDDFGLQTAIWASVYLVIGTWFEDQKLIKQYGQTYIDYRQKVPSVLPYRGRVI
jgi:protein-S-isoprenylcysteine O-methyltransferase Ste14